MQTVQPFSIRRPMPKRSQRGFPGSVPARGRSIASPSLPPLASQWPSCDTASESTPSCGPKDSPVKGTSAPVFRLMSDS